MTYDKSLIINSPPVEWLQVWKTMAMRKGQKLQDYDELNLMCIKLSPRGSGDGGSG